MPHHNTLRVDCSNALREVQYPHVEVDEIASMEFDASGVLHGRIAVGFWEDGSSRSSISGAIQVNPIVFLQEARPFGLSRLIWDIETPELVVPGQIAHGEVLTIAVGD